MQRRQLLWLACCAATLCGWAAGSPSEAPTPATPVVAGGPSSSATGTAAGSHVEPSRDGPGDGAASSPATATPGAGLRTAGTSTRPGHGPPHGADEEAAAGTASPAVTPSPGGTTAGTTAGMTLGTTVGTTVGTTMGTAAGSTEGTKAAPSSSGAPSQPGATVPAGGGGDTSSEAIACHQVKDVREPEGTCLQLQEANTCKHFLATKGAELWRAICEQGARRVPSPCRIQLSASEVERDCLLLVLPGEAAIADPATDVLHKSHWEKLGIKSLKRGSVRSHQDFSRKTLIALVTSGLLLAFLGLAGYFLMRRRSWSPTAERLGEDPYYPESDSQGNTMATTASQEPAEPPAKGSARGSAQENGTGQAASPNGCSAPAHGLADTAM